MLFVIIGGVILLFPIDNQIAVVVIVEFLTKDLQKVGVLSGQLLSCKSFLKLLIFFR